MTSIGRPASAPAEAGLGRPARSQSEWRRGWNRLRRNPTALLGLAGLTFLALMSIFAPWIAPYPPTKIDYDHPGEPPSAVHWFGTDDLGRDTFSRVAYGGRESLRVGFIAIFIALAGGIVVGLISGYYGGWIDSVIQRLMEIMLAFPTILLLLSIMAALGPGLSTALVAIGIAFIPSYGRVVRGQTLAAKHLEYVTAARVLGATSFRIMARHILPNIVPVIIVYGTLGLGGSIMLTAGLSYIGLGAQPPSPEWGSMLLYGRAYLRTAWWMSVFPGLAVFLAVLCINLLGDGLRDALDPRLRR
jgi:peptide/nickel transport system permease protein